MILDNVENIIVNGVVDPDIFVNGVHVWPNRGELRFYRVYITWDPAKQENMSFQGLGWNGNPGSLTSDMVIDPMIKDTSYSYTSMTQDRVEKILETNEQGGGALYCYGIAFDVDSNTFINFQWHTQKYYAPTGTAKIEVDAYYENGIVVRARKTVTQAADATFVIHDGEFD